MKQRSADPTNLPSGAVPNRADALVFGAKAALLRLRRSLLDLTPGHRAARHATSADLVDAPVLARVSSPLWGVSSGPRDFALTTGKVENLRRAARGLDGIVVPAGAVFSFWRQVGRPLRRRGFVDGRELREGCMIANVGGGLCQLSNALYEVALQAGVRIVERHAHTRIVPGSRAAAGRDATVFWNYLDLRWRAAGAVRLEVELTADALEVCLRGHAAVPRAPVIATAAAGVTAHDCLSCGRTLCHRHDAERADADGSRL